MQSELILAPAPIQLSLRPYQEKVVSEWEESIEKYKRTVIVAATGAGKTVISAEIIRRAIANYSWRIMFVVHRDVLIGQTHSAIKRMGLECGFIKAGWQENIEAPIQIASVQTLLRRSLWKSTAFNLLIFDECHCTAWSTAADTVQTLYPTAFILGLTATPWRLSKKEGFGDKFDHLVCAPLMRQLIEEGYLSPPIYYGLPEVDLSDVKTAQGDFVESELALKCDRDELIDEAISEWVRLAHNRKTICFAITVKHAQHIAARFCDRGIPFACVTGETPIHIRKRYYSDLADGLLAGISSVGCLTEGFDVSSIDCVLLCRPTKSKALHFQMIGRGLRIHEGKKNCIVIDQSGNTRRHGFVESLTKRGISLSKGNKGDPGEAMMKTCGNKGMDKHNNMGCGAMLYIFQMKCPRCGYLFPARESLAHIGKLKLLLPDEQVGQIEWYHSTLKASLTFDKPINWAFDLFTARYKKEPHDQWSLGAIFGEEPTLANAIALKQYCDRHNDSSPLAAEFGWDWEQRLKQAEAIAKGRNKAKRQSPKLPRSLYR
jgi:superfamily II DNA or RNA helicase